MKGPFFFKCFSVSGRIRGGEDGRRKGGKGRGKLIYIQNPKRAKLDQFRWLHKRVSKTPKEPLEDKRIIKKDKNRNALTLQNPLCILIKRG